MKGGRSTNVYECADEWGMREIEDNDWSRIFEVGKGVGQHDGRRKVGVEGKHVGRFQVWGLNMWVMSLGTWE